MKKNSLLGMISFFVVVFSALIMIASQAEVVLAVPFTMDQVAQHSTRADCWTLINNTVYDMSSYVSPSSDRETLINQLCGTNGTQALMDSGNATDLLPVIGDLAVGTFTDMNNETNNQTTNMTNQTGANQITILGDNPATVLLGSNYTDMGASALVYVGESLTSSSNVDINTVGNYSVMYDLNDSNGIIATANRTVMVVSSSLPLTNLSSAPPNITILGDNPATVTVGSTYTDAGANVQLPLNGNTGSMMETINTQNNVDTSIAGTYYVMYNLTSNFGDSVSATRTVMVVPENTSTGGTAGETPIITLLGNNPETVAVGSTYTDAGATAVDGLGGVDLTSSILMASNVDANAVGNYTVMYNVTDAVGNFASANRTVMVVSSVGNGTSGNNTAAPVITLLGDNPATVTVGSTYTDAGATAVDSTGGTNLTPSILMSSNVDANTVGNYVVTYNVTDSSGNVGSASRTVMVVPSGGSGADTVPPVVTVLGDNPVTLTLGSAYTDAGATASDNIDGDLTSSIATVNNVDVNTAGNYTVMYNVTDSSGNTAFGTRNVMVVSSNANAPTITLLGNNPETVNVGSIYADAGATAFDNVDGDLTSSIATTNNVDSNIAGNYTVTYTVTDSGGISATANRTVMVIPTVV